MTADSTTRLREALADSILDAIPDHTAWQDALLAADAILASLVEHQDDVLDVLGGEQLGWRWYEPRHVPGWRFATERPDWFPGEPPEPVYAFRPKEQPHGG